MGKKILVTGAGGFIGSNLVSKLVANNNQVFSLIRDTKKPVTESISIVADLTKDFSINENDFDCVFHLASHTPLEKNKKILENVNVFGTKNLYSKIKDKTKSIIYISGLGVYGDPGDRIIDESFPYNPTTDFVKMRLDAQKFLEERCIKDGIDFAVVHFGDVYGSRGWFYEMLVKRLLNKSFKLPGGGNYLKSFIHVEDAVGAMISILEKKAYGQSYIVADSTFVTFKDFVDFTADILGVKRPGSVPNILAKAVLGGDLVKLLTTSMMVSNKKISQLYDFKYPSYKDGIPKVIEELETSGVLKIQ